MTMDPAVGLFMLDNQSGMTFEMKILFQFVDRLLPLIFGQLLARAGIEIGM